jgi:hypothetical protein
MWRLRPVCRNFGDLVPRVLNVAVGVSSAFGVAVEEKVQQIEVAAVADLHEVETVYNQTPTAQRESDLRGAGLLH